MDDAQRQRLRDLPSVDEVVSAPMVAAALQLHGRPRVLAAARRALELARERIKAGQAEGFELDAVLEQLRGLEQPKLRRVLNATGVVLHTNLGRAPLSKAAVERIAEVARGYSNLELDLSTGERGSRYAPVKALLCELTGAEDALVVNNCAAATLLMLSAAGQGRAAIVSRGELVEIGGGFRMPDVMAQSGVKLIEVGTTNRTRLEDYERAITSETALLLEVHRSNFAIVGFTEAPGTRSLAQLAHSRGLPLLVDLGSGALSPLWGEPTVSEVVKAGADLVAFSGDKLLGGPQAGIVVGKRDWVDKLAQHPLTRALRIDKLTVAALEATLQAYRAGTEARDVPARALLAQTEPQLKARAEALHGLLLERGISAPLFATTGKVGGGSLPLAEPPSWACAISSHPVALHEALRRGMVPVVARLHDDRLLLDVRCLNDDDLPAVADAVAQAQIR